MVDRRLPGERWRFALCASGARTAAGILQRQVERERAAPARRAAQLDLAAEQVGKLAADRQAEAGAAVLAAGAGIGLLEGLEDDLLLLGRDADAGVRDLECDDRGRLARGSDDRRSSRAPATAMRSRTPPCSVNLKALESRFLRTCCRRLESVTMLRLRWESSSTLNDRWRRSASCRKGRATPSRSGWRSRSPPRRPRRSRTRSWTDRGCR